MVAAGRSLAEADSRLGEDIVGSALVVVVGSNLVEQAVRILEVGELSDISRSYAQLPSAAGDRRVHDLQKDYRKEPVLTALVWRLAIASLVVVVCHIWFLQEKGIVVVLDKVAVPRKVLGQLLRVYLRQWRLKNKGEVAKSRKVLTDFRLGFTKAGATMSSQEG